MHVNLIRTNALCLSIGLGCLLTATIFVEAKSIEGQPALAEDSTGKREGGVRPLQLQNPFVKMRQGSLQPFTEYVAIGYNLLKGNPDGDYTHGGVDPGIELSRRIFNLTYNGGKDYYYNGKMAPVPDQVAFQSTHSCSSHQIVKVFSGTSSYQDNLDISTDVEGGGSSDLFSFRFSMSAGYASAKAESSESKMVVMDKSIICNIGTVRYQLDTAIHTNYSVSNEFYYAVKKLPVVYSQADYMKFIEEWGTHIIVEAQLGGRLIDKYQSTYEQIYKFASADVKTSVYASGSYEGFSGSFSLDVNKFNQEAASSSTFGSYKNQTASGSTIVETDGVYHVATNDQRPPVPIHIKLIPISGAFLQEMWVILPEDADYTTLKIGQKYRNIITALNGYAKWIHAPTSSKEPVTIPNAWPDGTYTLPSILQSCPTSGDQFKWQYGYVYQDDEDDGNSNSYSKYANKYLGPFPTNHDMSMRYCSKTDTSKDYGIIWPPGAYCVAKKGDCPDGFDTPGHIKWDDEDDNNKDKDSGVIPDGVYGKDTTIYYCCRSDGFASNPITLPFDTKFALYRQSIDGCQQVNRYKVLDEWVYWDDEDDNNTSGSGGSYPYQNNGPKSDDHKLHYCIYIPS